jgi:hypothetical protein
LAIRSADKWTATIHTITRESNGYLVMVELVNGPTREFVAFANPAPTQAWLKAEILNYITLLETRRGYPADLAPGTVIDLTTAARVP